MQKTEELVEATPLRMKLCRAPEMPLPDQAGDIAGIANWSVSVRSDVGKPTAGSAFTAPTGLNSNPNRV